MSFAPPPPPPPPPPLLSKALLKASSDADAAEESSDDEETTSQIPSQWRKDLIPEIFKRRKGDRKKPWYEMREPVVKWTVENHPSFPKSFKKSSHELMLIGCRKPAIGIVIEHVLSYTHDSYFERDRI